MWFYMDKLGRVRVEKQSPQATVLAEFEVQYFVHLRVSPGVHNNRSVKKKGYMTGKFTYYAERDKVPIPSHEFGQLCTDRGDLLHALALSDTIREVRPVGKEFSRFEKM